MSSTLDARVRKRPEYAIWHNLIKNELQQTLYVRKLMAEITTHSCLNCITVSRVYYRCYLQPERSEGRPAVQTARIAALNKVIAILNELEERVVR